LLLGYATIRDLEIHQMDVDSAFLNAELKEEVYITQPEGYLSKKYPHYVCRLKKSLYGLKQAPLAWNQTLDSHLRANGFSPIEADSCIYVRQQEETIAIIAIYVDDCTIICHKSDLQQIKQMLSVKFKMKDLGAATAILGIEVIRNRTKGTLSLRQSGRIAAILKSFAMDNAKPANTPMAANLELPKLDVISSDDLKLPYRQAVGKLLYVAIASRPDISYAVSYLSRFVTGYSLQHWIAVKHLLRYLQGTRDMVLTYNAHTSSTSFDQQVPTGYTDADWGNDPHTRKSVTGFLFLYAGAPISWVSKAQTIVALSSTEAEYIAMSEATKHALYLRKFFRPLHLSESVPIPLHCDNQSAMIVATAQPHTTHMRIKHIAIKFHHIRDTIARNDITVIYCPTEHMIADFLTKPLAHVKFAYHRGAANLHQLP
ncbi:MAG: Ty1/Copia family ribonuclease HI, partial [Sulfobacillus sp.]